jgi:hypothetical protein
MFAAQRLPGSMKLAKFPIPILAALMLVGTMVTQSAAEEQTAEWEWFSLSATNADRLVSRMRETVKKRCSLLPSSWMWLGLRASWAQTKPSRTVSRRTRPETTGR